VLLDVEAGAGEHLLSCRRERAGHRHDHPDLDRALCVGVSGKSDRNCENGGENALPWQAPPSGSGAFGADPLLKYCLPFIVVLKFSMAKASQRLAISHPVVSKTISDLERTLGVKLFDRTSRGIELTTYGQVLLNCGVNVFDEMRQGLKRIEFLTDPTSGELAVGCPEIMNAGIVPAISERLLRQHPGVQLRVIHADTALMQFSPLRERKVLLIGRMPDPFVEDDLIFEPLLQEPFVAVAGANSQLARKRRIELADFHKDRSLYPLLRVDNRDRTPVIVKHRVDPVAAPAERQRASED